jgi:hypothetical protein
MLGSSWIAAQLAASEEWLISMKLVNYESVFWNYAFAVLPLLMTWLF